MSSEPGTSLGAVATSADSDRQLGGVVSHVSYLQQQVSRDSALLDSHDANLRAVQQGVRSLTDSIDRLLDGERQSLQAIARLQRDGQKARSRTEVAASLLLLGMLFEVLGGTMLAGAFLSAKQEHVASLLRSKPMNDLALVDKQHEPVMNFYGTIGGAFLVLGFILQFAGTTITSWLPLAARILSLVVATVIPFCLTLYFLGLTPGQSRRAKIRIITHNLKQHLVLPAIHKMAGAQDVECEVCLRAVSTDLLRVWWLYEKNSENYPFLNQPYSFHYGHERCLPCCDDYDVFFDVPGKYPSLHLGKDTARSFVENRVPEWRDWFAKFHEHWTKVRSQQSETTAPQERMERVYRKIEPVVRHAKLHEQREANDH
jgi:hypothetical protein